MHNAVFYILAVVALLWPAVTGPVALVAGIVISLVFRLSVPAVVKPWSSHLLGAAVSLLGAGIPLATVISSGGRGLGFSLALIVGTLVVGALLARKMQVDREIGTLISSGTAICGGSAIAAVSGAVKAKPEQTAIALAIVFVLNALAVFIFPPLGTWFGLTGEQFGMWAAMAIHDTSSVVAAAVAYGNGAEAVAVPMKLARALWIIPVAAVIGRIYAGKGGGKLPWFLATFVALAAFFSLFPEFGHVGTLLADAGKRLLVLVLFLIGASITKSSLQVMGRSSVILAVTLWLGISILSLWAILSFSSIV
ncbi:MAG: YeiH family protein [Candidatus Kapaibacteriota bacterium]